MSTKMFPLEVVNVRCLGEHHPIFLMGSSSGKLSLVLPKHREDSRHPLNQVIAMQTIAPEYKCRCYEVLCAWRVYTSWRLAQVSQMLTSTRRERPEALPLLASLSVTAKNKTRSYRKVSPSNVLALIPESFRSHAKLAREEMERREACRDNRVPTTRYSHLPKSDRKHFESRNAEFSSRKMITRHACFSARNQLGYSTGKAEHVEKWFRTRLRDAGLSRNRELGQHQSTPGSFIHNIPYASDGRRKRSINWWMRLYWDHPWVRQMIQFGFAPSSIPPIELWIQYRQMDGKVVPSHPGNVIAVRFKGDSYSSSEKYYIRIERNIGYDHRMTGDFSFQVSSQPNQRYI